MVVVYLNRRLFGLLPDRMPELKMSAAMQLGKGGREEVMATCYKGLFLKVNLDSDVDFERIRAIFSRITTDAPLAVTCMQKALTRKSLTGLLIA